MSYLLELSSFMKLIVFLVINLGSFFVVKVIRIVICKIYSVNSACKMSWSATRIPCERDNERSLITAEEQSARTIKGRPQKQII
jgi:hypothetical protein